VRIERREFIMVGEYCEGSGLGNESEVDRVAESGVENRFYLVLSLSRDPPPRVSGSGFLSAALLVLATHRPGVRSMDPKWKIFHYSDAPLSWPTVFLLLHRFLPLRI
jgi:hypothetical protein